MNGVNCKILKAYSTVSSRLKLVKAVTFTFKLVLRNVQ